MTYAIRIHAQGGPEVLQWEEVEVGAPAPGEARVRHHAVGLNYIDVYHRSGTYPLGLPAIPGLEGAGWSRRSAPGSAGSRSAIAWRTPADRSAPTVKSG